MRSPVSRRAQGECDAIRSRGFSHSELTFVSALEIEFGAFLSPPLANQQRFWLATTTSSATSAYSFESTFGDKQVLEYKDNQRIARLEFREYCPHTPVEYV
jgi:hypothetical protein